MRDDATARRIEVTLAWGDNVLEALYLAPGESLTIGDSAGADRFLPAAGACALAFDGRAILTVVGEACVMVDGGACARRELRLEEESVVVVILGAFTIRAAIVAAAPRSRRAPWIRDTGLGWLGVSALLHVAPFLSLALVLPGLVQADDEIARDHWRTMDRLLSASVERDAPGSGADAHLAASGDDHAGGRQAKGASGAMGTPSSLEPHARWQTEGSASSDALPSREHELASARSFGLVGLLEHIGENEPNAPAAPWSDALAGAAPASHLGNLWSGDSADAFGIGGLGLSGSGEGGGGSGEGVGINNLGDLGHSLERRVGGGDTAFGCKAGRCAGHVNGTHAAMRMAITCGVPKEAHGGCMTLVSGRLPPEAIQRVIQQNAGRFRTCYEAALRTNPALAGRVAVRFVINRDGAVAIAADANSDMPDATVRACVVRSFYGLSFPPPAGGTVNVIYPLVFTPAE